MSTTSHRSIVRGSERQPLHGAQAVGAVPADERFEVTVRVRRKAPQQQVFRLTRGLVSVVI